MDGRQLSLFTKTSQGCSRRRTTHSDASLERCAGVMKPLKLRQESGLKQAFSVEKPDEWVIESLMPNTLAWLNVDGESFSLPCLVNLSAVLEGEPVHQKYSLSQKACQGILRRAERRGKALPEPLREALQAVAGGLSDQESLVGKTTL